MTRLTNFIKWIGRKLKIFPEVWTELRKVVWPSRRDATRLTVTILIIVIVVAIILGSIDYGFLKLISLFIGG